MKTPEEIKMGIRCDGPCIACPYRGTMISDLGCAYHVKNDTLCYIQQLEDQIEFMKIQMQGDCGVCKYTEVRGGLEPCASCMLDAERPAWEYGGMPEKGAPNE